MRGEKELLRGCIEWIIKEGMTTWMKERDQKGGIGHGI